MSPANKAYMDMKYDPSTPLGLSWAGYIEVRTACDWDPGNHVQGVGEESVLGVEAPLWSALGRDGRSRVLVPHEPSGARTLTRGRTRR